MKLIITMILSMTVWFSYALNNGDTVIIELNNSKIIIYTKTKMDLADLENYDINRMIKDLNTQLDDSVKYLQIDSEEGKSYLKKEDNTYADNDRIDIDLGNVQVEIDPDEIEDFDDDWSDRKKSTEMVERANRTTHHFNIDLGVNNWLENGDFPDANGANYSVKPWGSWYLALNSVNRSWVFGPVFLEWGAGVSWYSWKLDNPDFRITEGDERVELVTNPDENGIKSKLTASYVNVHLVPMFDFSGGRRKLTKIESNGVRIKKYSRRGFRFGVGAYAGYRLGSHTKFKFNGDGSTEKDRERDNYFLENFRYGLRAQIGWKEAEFFVNYDMNEVFSSGRGPQSAELNAISFGVIL
ncbi:MAG: hypothetical protein AAF551_03835 [Bacteroidota bacterium]